MFRYSRALLDIALITAKWQVHSNRYSWAAVTDIRIADKTKCNANDEDELAETQTRLMQQELEGRELGTYEVF